MAASTVLARANCRPASRPGAAPQRRTVEVLEYFAEAPKVDKEKGIVYGVKILGRISKNGHGYSDDSIRATEQSHDNVVVNLDHPPDRNATAERRVQERFGVIRNPKAEIVGDPKIDGSYAEHHFPLTHPYTPQYLEALERFPNTIGFSHNAVVTESVKDGRVTFESIERVRSVDLVANPATTRGVFESEESRMNPDDPNYVDPTKGDAGDPDAGDPDTDESIRDALKQMVFAVFDDENASVEEIRKKIAAILDLKEKLDGDGDSDDAAGDPKDDTGDPKDDTASLKDRLTKLEQELKAKNTLESAREALEKAGFRPSKVEVKAFSVLESGVEQDEFVATLKKAAAPERAKPRSTSAHALESQKPGDGSDETNCHPLVKSQDDLQRLTAELLAC